MAKLKDGKGSNLNLIIEILQLIFFDFGLIFDKFSILFTNNWFST